MDEQVQENNDDDGQQPPGGHGIDRSRSPRKKRDPTPEDITWEYPRHDDDDDDYGLERSEVRDRSRSFRRQPPGTWVPREPTNKEITIDD